MERIRFRVFGRPLTQGSKRIVPILRHGEPVMKNGHVLTRVVDDNPRLGQWRAAVAQRAAEVYRGPLWDGPISLKILFHLRRPKSHFGSGRNAGRLKPSSPAWPTIRPDLLKLARAVEDALSGVLWRDDAQIVRHLLRKQYGERFAVDVIAVLLSGEYMGRKRKERPHNPTIRLKAKLGAASIGAETASLAVKFARDQVESLDQIVEFFVGARLAVTIDTDSDVEQRKLAGMDGQKLRSIAELGRASIGVEDVSAKLQFNKAAIDTHTLSDFAQQQVVLIAERIGEASKDRVPEDQTANMAVV